jgi:hypothetical protein
MPYKNYKFCPPTQMEPPHPPALVSFASCWQHYLQPSAEMSPLFTAPCPRDHVSSYHKHLSLPWLLLSRNISSNTCSYLWVNMFHTDLPLGTNASSIMNKGKDTGDCRPSRGWGANFKSTTHKAPFLQLSLPLHQKRPSSNHEALSMFCQACIC